MQTDRFTDYLLWERKYSAHTVGAYATDLAEFGRYLEENDLPQDDGQIDYQMVRGWVVFLMERGFSPSSVNRKISALRSYFKFLVRRGTIEVSPMIRQGNLKEPKRVTVPYSVQEMRHLLAPDLYVDDPDGERNRLMMELFYGCGLRCSELCDVKAGDLDFAREMVRVRGKGSKERFVPMHQRLCSALRDYLARQDGGGSAKESLLFAKNGKKMPAGLVYRIINKYLGLVTVKMKKSPHVLRHSFATHLMESGADISSVKELLGHSSLASTQVYTHTSLGKLKSVYNQAHPRGDENPENGGL